MKNSTQCAKRLTALLKKLQKPEIPDLPTIDDPIGVLVMSFLMWESTTPKAVIAYNNILSNVVDHNDLRVCMPQETIEFIGQRYPRGLDRCQRLRAVLRDIYSREHAVSLERLSSMGKRDVRKYLESLEGIVPYVSARVMLLSFQTHAIPVDDQLRTQLIEQGAADSSAENDELSTWLERQIKASDGVDAHYALQAWMDSNAGSNASRSTARKSRAGKKKATGKKATSSNGRAGKTKKKLSKA